MVRKEAGWFSGWCLENQVKGGMVEGFEDVFYLEERVLKWD